MARAARLALLGVALWLGGCGFHLRGTAGFEETPLSAVYLAAGAEESEMAAALETALSQVGVRRVTSAEEADARIVLHRYSERRRVLSVGEEARVREYELIARLVFSAQAGDDGWRVPRTRLEAMRDITFDPTQVLGRTREQEVFYEEMRRGLAQRVLRRLNAQLRAADG